MPDSIYIELNDKTILSAQGTLDKPSGYSAKLDRAKRDRMKYSCKLKKEDGTSKRITSDRGTSKSETLAFLKDYAKKLYPDAKFETVK